MCHNALLNDDVIKWKHVPRYWPVVRGIHRSQRPVTRSFDIFVVLCLKKRLSKQLRSRWFEMPSHSVWRHCTPPRGSRLCCVVSRFNAYRWWHLSKQPRSRWFEMPLWSVWRHSTTPRGSRLCCAVSFFNGCRWWHLTGFSGIFNGCQLDKLYGFPGDHKQNAAIVQCYVHLLYLQSVFCSCIIVVFCRK